MSTFEFEGMPNLNAEITHFEARVRELGGSLGAEPQTIIRLGTAWQIETEWEVVGPAAKLLGPNGIPGNYLVDAYLESIGLAAEHNLGRVVVPMAGVGVHGGAASPIAVPAAAVATAGPYKLVITLTADNGFGAILQMAGYMEGPILQFY